MKQTIRLKIGLVIHDSFRVINIQMFVMVKSDIRVKSEDFNIKMVWDCFKLSELKDFNMAPEVIFDLRGRKLKSCTKAKIAL